jgi:hypothetical protein|tara:strand:+ start:237 stop:518 length:282 start_codon:yes stop_codon:yes gene_type:complete
MIDDRVATTATVVTTVVLMTIPGTEEEVAVEEDTVVSMMAQVEGIRTIFTMIVLLCLSIDRATMMTSTTVDTMAKATLVVTTAATIAARMKTV